MFSYHKTSVIAIYKSYNKKFVQAQSPKEPRVEGKRAYNTGSINAGSATVEASLIMPLVLMLIYALWSMGCMLIMHNVIYEGLLETAARLAEYQYLFEQTTDLDGTNDVDYGTADLGDMSVDDGTVDLGDMSVDDYGTVDLSGTYTYDAGTAVTATLAYTYLKEYIDNSELVEKYVTLGMNGLVFTEAHYDTEDGYIYLTVSYEYGADIPFFGILKHTKSESVRQKAYTGYMGDAYSDDAESYVYVTENASVYHTSRSCTHISLSISQVTGDKLTEEYGNLSACEYCTSNYTGTIYVTEEGDRYHYSLSCPGLKRTVYRKKKSEVSLPACERCGSE